MAEMIQSRRSWNELIRSITGVADCWKPSCQGEGCPIPASAIPPPAAMATTSTANAINRLNTSIVGLAPSNEALRRPPHRTPPAGAAATAALSAASAGGAAPRRARGGNLRGILASQTIIPAPSQCTPSMSPVRPKADKSGLPKARLSTLSRPQCPALLILDASVRPWPRGLIRPGMGGGAVGLVEARGSWGHSARECSLIGRDRWRRSPPWHSRL